MWGEGHQQPSLRHRLQEGRTVWEAGERVVLGWAGSREPAIRPPPHNTGSCQHLASFHRELALRTGEGRPQTSLVSWSVMWATPRAALCFLGGRWGLSPQSLHPDEDEGCRQLALPSGL